MKPAPDESVASSVTLQDDDHLLFPVLAGETWIFDALLIVSGSSTADIKLAFNAPAGSTIRWGAIGDSTAILNSGPDWNVVSVAGTSVNYDIQTGPTYLRIRGIVVAGNRGTVNLQWAQATASATPTVVQQLSYLQASKF